jgi:6-phosphogluconolactonase (cycloisomerase 2 family)
MSLLVRSTAIAGLALGVGVVAAPAASADASRHAPDVVFVQSDALTGNSVVAFDRGEDGALHRAGLYPTGGRGGALTGAVVDHTASQGALTADRDKRELYAVNAGSNTLSVFSVRGDRLQLRQVVHSGGSFPVSVTVHDDVVYVLNARDGGSIQGFRNVDGTLVAISGSHRELGLPVTTGSAEFTHTPGQVLFTPDGRNLVVSTKAATDSLLVFAVSPSGRPSEAPVVHTEAGAVPFGLAFDGDGRLAVTNTGTNSVATYRVRRSGTITSLGVAATGQAATCWVTAEDDLLAASNAGSGSVTTLRTDAAGAVTKIADAKTAGGGTVDAAFSRSGDELYVQTGATGAVDTFAVNDDGTLTRTSTVTVPDAVGGEGIVAW